MRYSSLLFLSALAISSPSFATTLLYNDFSSTAGLQVNGNSAAVNDGSRNVLRMTPATFSQAGSVFSTTALTFGPTYGFSTRFTFNFNNQGNGGADGIVLVIQPNSNTVGGAGGGIGYFGIPNSLGIEFDNWFNAGFDDSDNQVGIDLNGDINSVVRIDSPFVLDSGQDLTAWVDYNGTTQMLEVRMNNSNVRPLAALLSYSVDLAAVIGNPNAFVGFTSGTGAAFANHDIVNWEFRDTFAPITAVPEPQSWLTMIAGFGLAGLMLRRKMTNALRLA